MTPPQSDQARWFADEVQPHEPVLRAYLRGAFPAVRDVDDVVQESYLRVWRARAVEPIRSARAFLFTVARRLALDWVRHESHSPLQPVGNLDALSVVEDRPGVASSVSLREKIDLVAEGLLALPPRCREVIMLYRLKGLSRSEVAGRMCISEKTVDEQVARGVRRLEEFLRARGVDGCYEQ